MRAIGIAIALGVVGLVGFTLGGLRSSTSTPEAPAHAAVVTREAAGIDDAALRATIRATIRDELRAQTAATATAASPEPQVVEPSHEQVAARRDADALIVSAVGAGRWREEDRDRFAVVSRNLTEVERNEVLRPLVVAINAQRVTLDFVGPAL